MPMNKLIERVGIRSIRRVSRFSNMLTNFHHGQHFDVTNKARTFLVLQQVSIDILVPFRSLFRSLAQQK